MKVLITNLALLGRSGTETYVRDLALGLSKRGVEPMVYSPRLGPGIPDELRDHGINVVDDIGKLSAVPDLIHGHHNLPTMVAMLNFPGTPGLFVCHDALAWHDAPPRLPSLRRYVVVGQTRYDRLVSDYQIPAEMVSIISNSVDVERFSPRAPLPVHPRRALLFNNYIATHNHLPAIESACRRAGLELDVRGAGSGNVASTPEILLRDYDLVFGVGRCALEAMAVGCAVILCSVEGAGNLVTAEEFDHMLRFNFGRAVIPKPIEADHLVGQIKRYDVARAAEVSRLVRDRCSLEGMIDQWLNLYQSILSENGHSAAEVMTAPEKKDIADYLLHLEGPLFSLFELTSRVQHLEAQARQRRPGLLRRLERRLRRKRPTAD